MSKNSGDYHVVPNPDGGWDVKRPGAKRTSSHHDTKKPAMDRGRELSRKSGGELVDHGRDGRIRDKDSHGRDPFPPRDKNR